MNESFTLRIGIVWWVQVILFVPTVIDVFALIAVFQGEEGAVFAFALFTFLAILGLANIFAKILVIETDVTVSVFMGAFAFGGMKFRRSHLVTCLLHLKDTRKG